MTISESLLAALLVLHSHIPEPMGSCIRGRQTEIARQAQEASDRTGVPPAIILVVGFMESHFGCHPRSGGCWGAPVDPQHRQTAGTHMHAAVALQHSFAVCHSWQGAISRFRCGLCRCPSNPDYVANATRWVTDAHAHLSLPLPDQFHAPVLARR